MRGLPEGAASPWPTPQAQVRPQGPPSEGPVRGQAPVDSREEPGGRCGEGQGGGLWPGAQWPPKQRGREEGAAQLCPVRPEKARVLGAGWQSQRELTPHGCHSPCPAGPRPQPCLEPGAGVTMAPRPPGGTVPGRQPRSCTRGTAAPSPRAPGPRPGWSGGGRGLVISAPPQGAGYRARSPQPGRLSAAAASVTSPGPGRARGGGAQGVPSPPGASYLGWPRPVEIINCLEQR